MRNSARLEPVMSCAKPAGAEILPEIRARSSSTWRSCMIVVKLQKIEKKIFYKNDTEDGFFTVSAIFL